MSNPLADILGLEVEKREKQSGLATGTGPSPFEPGAAQPEAALKPAVVGSMAISDEDDSDDDEPAGHENGQQRQPSAPLEDDAELEVFDKHGEAMAASAPPVAADPPKPPSSSNARADADARQKDGQTTKSQAKLDPFGIQYQRVVLPTDAGAAKPSSTLLRAEGLGESEQGSSDANNDDDEFGFSASAEPDGSGEKAAALQKQLEAARARMAQAASGGDSDQDKEAMAKALADAKAAAEAEQKELEEAGAGAAGAGGQGGVGAEEQGEGEGEEEEDVSALLDGRAALRAVRQGKKKAEADARAKEEAAAHAAMQEVAKRVAKGAGASSTAGAGAGGAGAAGGMGEVLEEEEEEEEDEDEEEEEEDEEEENDGKEGEEEEQEPEQAPGAQPQATTATSRTIVPPPQIPGNNRAGGLPRSSAGTDTGVEGVVDEEGNTGTAAAAAGQTVSPLMANGAGTAVAAGAEAGAAAAAAMDEFNATSAMPRAGRVVASGTTGRAAAGGEQQSLAPIGWREAWRAMATPDHLRHTSRQLVREIPDPEGGGMCGCLGGGPPPLSQAHEEQRDMVLAMRLLRLQRGDPVHGRVLRSTFVQCTQEVPAGLLPPGSENWEVVGAQRASGPDTDLRSNGMAGMVFVLRLVEAYPLWIRRQVLHPDPNARLGFPLLLTAFAVLAEAVKVLRMGRLNGAIRAGMDVPDAGVPEGGPVWHAVFGFGVALLAHFERTFMKEKRTQLDVSVVLKEVAKGAGKDPGAFILEGLRMAGAGEARAKRAGGPWYAGAGAGPGAGGVGVAAGQVAAGGAAGGGEDEGPDPVVEADGTLWRGGSRLAEGEEEGAVAGGAAPARSARYGGGPGGGADQGDGEQGRAAAAPGEFSAI